MWLTVARNLTIAQADPMATGPAPVAPPVPVDGWQTGAAGSSPNGAPGNGTAWISWLIVLGIVLALYIRYRAKEARKAEEKRSSLIQAVRASELGLRDLLTGALGVRDPVPELEQFLDQLTRTQSAAEAGIGLDPYCALVADLRAALRQLERANDGRIDNSAVQLAAKAGGFHDAAVRCAQKAGQIQLKHNPGSFIGGGFGIAGALEGIVIADALNAATNNTADITRQIGFAQLELESNLWLSRCCLAHLERVTDLQRAKTITCANCNRALGKLELPQVWQGHSVCPACMRLLVG